MEAKKWIIRSKFQYKVAIFGLGLMACAIYMVVHRSPSISLQNALHEHEQEQTWQDQEPITQEVERIALNSSISSCDFFSGRWVLGNDSHPPYNDRQCSFMLDEYACEKYGRKDLKYRDWQWQPHDCDLPRFNGTVFMEKLRGKKLVFVGDSLNRNQFTSMLCLIETSASASFANSVIRNGNSFNFEAVEYNASIGFYWSPFLVESNNDDPFIHTPTDRRVRIESIEKHGRHWSDADILVFDSFIWWFDPTLTILWGSFGSPDAIYRKVEARYRLYEMGLATWSDWLEFNINRSKTQLFFMSISPTHIAGETWAEKSCYNETEPIFKDEYWGIAADREMMRIAESAIQKLETRGLKVQYLNITHMSDYRKDGHPSVHRKFFHPLSEEQLREPKSYADCAHWCLPGIPDVWNAILYHYIMNS